MHKHLVAALLILSGCLGAPQDAAPATTPAAPDASQSPAASEPEPEPVPVDEAKRQPPRLNLTACAGHLLYLAVPPETVADDLPPAYQPRNTLPASTWIIVRVDSCSQSAIDGQDQGPLTMFTVLVPIQVQGVPEKQDDPVPVYALQILTSHAAFLEWIRNATEAASEGTIEHEATPLAADLELLTGHASSAQSTYEWTGAADGLVDRVTEHLRLFTGPDPAIDWIDVTEAYDRSMSDGPATLTASQDSVIAKTLDGSPSVNGIMSIRRVEAATWERPILG